MSKKRRYYLGLIAEYITIILYSLRLYKIIAHRMRSYVGEIDLIFVKGNNIIFVEVKANNSYANDFIRNKQKERISRAAGLFLARHNNKYSSYNVRFDLVVIRAYKWPYIIENAW